MQKTILVLLIIAGLIFNSYAQELNSLSSLKPYLPKLDGSLKTKLELDLKNNKMRFQVRNARFGTLGNINPYVGYRAEVDLNDEGKIKMLDAYVKIMPAKNLDLYLGQRKVPFGSDYLRSPVNELFANRSFVAKYVNDGLRDIGFVTNYRFTLLIPFDVWLGAMNGTGNNNPQWIEHPSYSARMVLGPVKNFRLAGNYYHGRSETESKLVMYGTEIRYMTEKLLIESEYIHRTFRDSTNTDRRQYGFYIHSYYNLFTGWKVIRIISPVLRYDFMGDAILIQKVAERITTGINFGFEPELFKAEIRLNYEKYFKRYYSSHFDKFVIEFIAKF